MPTAKNAKPSYLGLLNAISVAETAAEPLFLAWADRTDDPKLAETLRFVGMREGEHGKAFAKRMLELGYEVREPARPGPDPENLRIAGSRRSDLRKFDELGFGQGQGDTDIFDAMFQDKTIDPTTGALLGRYIAEERDSLRRLTAEHDRLKRAAGRKKSVKKKQTKPVAKK
ncbi:MAG: manganese catalase family protein [Acidimicrobiia bacterium]|nr:manganese catalase family protein [Acidimicrobiia bacterium]